MQEITAYLVGLESSHICHVTEKTCYGALQLQAKVLFALGIIEEPTVENFLSTSKKILQ